MTDIAEQVRTGSPGSSTEVRGGLVSEWTRAGNWLFRRRSHLPLLVVAFLLWLSYGEAQAASEGGLDGWEMAGIGVGLLGLALRIWTVGHAPKGTSTRGTKQPEATSLSTEGVYSLIRHPLYLGNFAMWVGVALTTGSAWGTAVTALVFWIYNDRIMLAEERFLREKFGARFDAWAAHTPALIPRFRGWRPHSLPFSLRFALGRDVSAVYALVATTTVVELAEGVGAGRGFALDPFWWVWLGAGTAAYVVLVALKKTGRLEVSGR